MLAVAEHSLLPHVSQPRTFFAVYCMTLSVSLPPRTEGDGSSLTAPLSDALGEDSPLPLTYNKKAEKGGAPKEDEEDVARSEDAHQAAGGGGDGGAETAGDEEEAVGADGDAADGGGADRPGVGCEDGDEKPVHDEPAVAGEGGVVDGDLEPEEVLTELSLEGTKALEGGNGSYSSSLSDGDTTAAATAATSGEAVTHDSEESAASPCAANRTSSGVARSLFGFSGKGGGGGKGLRAGEGDKLGANIEDAEGGKLDDTPVVPSKEEIELQSRYAYADTCVQ